MLGKKGLVMTGEVAMTEGGDGAEEARAAGRARVREILLVPLAGLERPRGVAAAEYEALADRLAYMTPEALRGLCEFVLAVAGKAARGGRVVCPAPSLIRAFAHGIQLPPPHQSDYVASVMRSVLGLEALHGGWLVQLYRHLRKFGPPLAMSDWQKGQLRDAAAEDARQLARVRERRDAGAPWPEDRAWLAAWHDDLRAAEALVAEGEARRAARAVGA